MGKRAPGACLQCVRSKRQCDHGRPRCGRCARNNLVCDKQDFKPWRNTRIGKSAFRVNTKTPSPSSNSDSRPGASRGIPVQLSGCLDNDRKQAIDQLIQLAHEAIEADMADPQTPLSQRSVSHSVDVTPCHAATDRHVNDSSLLIEVSKRSTMELLPRISALPPDLQNSPHQMFLWQYFIDTCSHTFRCWTDNYNPFSIYLPTMASWDLTVRSAALAFSADCYNQACLPESSTFPTQGLRIETLNRLVRNNVDSHTSPDSFLFPLAAALLLYRFDVHSRGYLLPIARSAVSCIRASCMRQHQSSPQYRAFVALLVMTDICAYTSLVPQAPLPIYEDLVSTLESDSVDDAHQYDRWITHPIYGFSSRLLSPLLKLGRLIQMRRSKARHEELESIIGALEEELLLAYEYDHEAGKDAPLDPEDLLHVNEAMHSAAFIMFYTRLRDMSFTAQLIRRHVAKVQSEAALVDAESLSSRALVYPLFMAGCEAMDSSMRELITERLLNCRNYAVIQTGRLREQLEQIWRIRDNDPGQTWFQWTKKACENFEPLIVF